MCRRDRDHRPEPQRFDFDGDDHAADGRLRTRHGPEKMRALTRKAHRARVVTGLRRRCAAVLTRQADRCRAGERNMRRQRERREQGLQRDRVGCHQSGETAKSNHAGTIRLRTPRVHRDGRRIRRPPPYSVRICASDQVRRGHERNAGQHRVARHDRECRDDPFLDRPGKGLRGRDATASWSAAMA